VITFEPFDVAQIQITKAKAPVAMVIGYVDELSQGAS
jgi:hypothetical protein